jgi:hypothetical protein
MDILEAAVTLLPMLGASITSVQRHLLLAREHHSGNSTRAAWLSDLQRLRLAHPYTYNLIQALASAWHRHAEFKRYALPHHYAVNQLRALAQRYTGGATDGRVLAFEPDAIPKVVPMQPALMAVCRVCYKIYSIVRKAERKRVPVKEEKKKRKPGNGARERKTDASQPRRKTITTHGYPCVHVDLATDEIYCTSGKSVAHESCSAQPLAQINMIGYEVYLKGSLYALCPQPGCGQLAVLEMGCTNYTTYGLSCYSCSLAQQAELLASTTGQMHATLQKLRRFNAKTQDSGGVSTALSFARAPPSAMSLITEKPTAASKRKAKDGDAYDEDSKSSSNRAAMQEEQRKRRSCFLCGKRVIPSKMWIFGMSTFLCAGHPITHLVEHVCTGLQSYGFPLHVQINDPKESVTRSLLLEYHEKWQEEQAIIKKQRAKAERRRAEKNQIIRRRLKR